MFCGRISSYEDFLRVETISKPSWKATGTKKNFSLRTPWDWEFHHEQESNIRTYSQLSLIFKLHSDRKDTGDSYLKFAKSIKESKWGTVCALTYMGYFGFLIIKLKMIYIYFASLIVKMWYKIDLQKPSLVCFSNVRDWMVLVVTLMAS